MEFTQTNFVNNPEWNQITFTSTSGRTQVEIGSIDKDNEMEFFVVEGNETTSFYLNRENIQQLITHLQKQIQ